MSQPTPVPRTLEAHAALITRGVVSPLASVPFHAAAEAPVTRHVLVGDGSHARLGQRIIAHAVDDVASAQRAYCEPHVHDCDELNILLSLTRLVYEIRLGEHRFVVEAPATIYVPAGLVHSANVIEGSGFFLALIASPVYAASAAP